VNSRTITYVKRYTQKATSPVIERYCWLIYWIWQT